MESVGAAEDRVIRYFARFISSGALFYGLLLVPSIVEQSGSVHSWYLLWAVPAAFGPLLALWPASFARTLRPIRVLGSVTAAAYMSAAALWLVALNASTISPTDDVWLSTFPGLAAMAAALAWRPVWAGAYLVASASTGQFLHYVSRDYQQDVSLVSGSFYITMFCSLFVLATITAVRTGRTLDLVTGQAVEQAIATAESLARATERARFDALIHDRVMSTLLELGRAGSNLRTLRQSQLALDELDSMRDPQSQHGGTVRAEDAIATIRSELVSIREDIHIEVETLGDLANVPLRAARSLASAAGEALRNSVRHADRALGDTERIALVTISDRTFGVTVADNGRGFDPAAVPPYRLGIAVSIRGRMRQEDGCEARVESAQGKGTRVTMTWSAQ